MRDVQLWGYDSGNSVWRKIVVNDEGKLIIDPSEVTLDKLGDVDVPTPTDQYLVYWDSTAGKWKCKALVDADIPAAIARDTEVTTAIADHTAIPAAHHTRYTDAEAKAAAVLAGAITDAETKAPTHDAVYDIINADKTIKDADGDTKIQTEESADEDKIRMDVKGVEAFLLSDAGILTLAKQSAARAYKHAADQTVAHNTAVKVILEAENYDIQGEFDPVTNYRFTAKEAGLYLIVAVLDYEPVVNTYLYQVRIHKNGVYFQASNSYAVGTLVATPTTVGIVQLAANDYLEVYAFQLSGVTATLVKAWDGCWLAVMKIA